MENSIIKIRNLSKQYSTASVKAVDTLSFDVKQGELFAFLGVNGAGKSTTIHILCTLLKKTSGEVTICGFDLETQADQVKSSIGVVFQNGVLDEKLSVYDNLLIRGSLFGISKEILLKRIQDTADRLHMSDFLKRPYGKLSGGQKRKSDIARALISNPKILFLDEPTTGLDPQSRVDLWNVIQDIRDQFHTTVFVTTHYMEEVNGADRVAIMDQGRLLCIDTPENLKSKYSMDLVRLTVKEGHRAEVENELHFQEVPYDFAVDTYTIHIKSGLLLIDTISKLKPFLTSAEIIKGDMDSVFLNVVGRSFENE